jgi:hypothetical protein
MPAPCSLGSGKMPSASMAAGRESNVRAIARPHDERRVSSFIFRAYVRRCRRARSSRAGPPGRRPVDVSRLRPKRQFYLSVHPEHARTRDLSYRPLPRPTSTDNSSAHGGARPTPREILGPFCYDPGWRRAMARRDELGLRGANDRVARAHFRAWTESHHRTCVGDCHATHAAGGGRRSLHSSRVVSA